MLLEDRIVKRLLVIFVALALFTSTVWSTSITPEANAEATPLQNYKLYSDGGGSTPSIHWDGAKFTLTENIEGTISIESDGVVFDGAGFTVKGKGDSTGIVLYDKNNVTINNVKVENFQIGILLGHYIPNAFLWSDPNPNRPTNCTVRDCQVSNNTSGVSIAGGRNCRIIGNQAKNNTKGITFYGSENLFRNNQMANNGINFEDMAIEKSDVDSSNTINGKPIYYIINQQNLTVPANAALVHLENSSNIIIRNLELKYTYKAISLLNSNNCKIYQNTITDGEIGISLRNSANNSIIGNKSLNNSDSAIEQHDSENTKITNNLVMANGGGIDSVGYGANSGNADVSSNQIINNSGCGIQAGPRCTITNNYVFGNQRGIFAYDYSDLVISNNNVTENELSGMSFLTGKNAFISGNVISKNGVGIMLGNPSQNTIVENSIIENGLEGIQIDGYATDNHIYNNNFVANNNGSNQVSIKGVWVYKGDNGYDESSSEFPQFIAGYANKWDNGTVGNYWSDYSITADGALYKIDDNNQDDHPLLTPMKFGALEMPSIETPLGLLPEATQTQETRPENFHNALILAIVAVVTAVAVGVGLYYRKRLRRK